MHDPHTVAFEIHMPFTGKKNKVGAYIEFPKTLLRIWHVDPQKDGTDDSCGWFMQARHGNKETFEKIKIAYRFEWSYLFGDDGLPIFSAHATTLALFRWAAAWHFNHNWAKVNRYMQANIYDLLSFAENPTDSLYRSIYSISDIESKTDRIDNFARIIYGYLLRTTRPWHKAPRWHVWHWEIDIPVIKHIKRYLFSRCCHCGKGFKYGESPSTYGWNGSGPQWFKSETDIYHSACLPSPYQVKKEN